MIRFAAVLIIACMCGFTGTIAGTAPPRQDNTSGINLDAYLSMLQQLVDAHGRVAYRGFQQHPGFETLVEQIARANPSAMSTDELLAFYLNAYNILVIKNVADHYPIASPKDVDGFLNVITFNVGGTRMTLDMLAETHLRPLGGAFAHFGMVCGAKSCPRLIRVPYTATNVRKLLKENAARFLQDQSKNRLDRGENTLYLADVFESFAEDFEKEAGSVRSFILPLVSPSDREYIESHNVSIGYLPYSWDLNTQ